MSFRERSLERSSNSGGRLRMDRNPQPSRINDPSLAAGRRKEIDNLMKKARKDPNDYWDKKILEVEERDPNRWRHTGYKKMYVDDEKSSNGRSRSISPRARRPLPPPKTHSSRYSPLPPFHHHRSPLPPSRRDRSPPSPVGRRSPPLRRAVPHSPLRRPISPDMRKPHLKPPAPYRRPPSPPQPIRSSSSSSSSSSEHYYRSEKYSRSRTPTTQSRHRVIRSPSYQATARNDRKPPPLERRHPDERVERHGKPSKGPPLPVPSSSSSSHRSKQTSPKPRVTSTSDDYVAVREREKAREHRAAAATAVVAAPAPAKVNKHKKVRKTHKHVDVKIKIEDEPKRAPRSPSSSSSSSSDDDNSVIFSALNSNTKLTLSERFGKIAQWSVDRSNMENMRITKNKAGGDLKVLIEEGIQSPTNNPRRRSYTPVRPAGHFPEELLAEGPSDLGSWDDVAVRYNYYKSIGYLRGLGLNDYMKWEEWWWQYQAWLRRCEQWERGQMNRRRRRKIPITARLN